MLPLALRVSRDGGGVLEIELPLGQRRRALDWFMVWPRLADDAPVPLQDAPDRPRGARQVHRPFPELRVAVQIIEDSPGTRHAPQALGRMVANVQDAREGGVRPRVVGRFVGARPAPPTQGSTP